MQRRAWRLARHVLAPLAAEPHALAPGGCRSRRSAPVPSRAGATLPCAPPILAAASPWPPCRPPASCGWRHPAADTGRAVSRHSPWRQGSRAHHSKTEEARVSRGCCRHWGAGGMRARCAAPRPAAPAAGRPARAAAGAPAPRGHARRRTPGGSCRAGGRAGRGRLGQGRGVWHAGRRCWLRPHRQGGATHTTGSALGQHSSAAPPLTACWPGLCSASVLRARVRPART